MCIVGSVSGNNANDNCIKMVKFHPNKIDGGFDVCDNKQTYAFNKWYHKSYPKLKMNIHKKIYQKYQLQLKKKKAEEIKKQNSNNENKNEGKIDDNNDDSDDDYVIKPKIIDWDGLIPNIFDKEYCSYSLVKNIEYSKVKPWIIDINQDNQISGDNNDVKDDGKINNFNNDDSNDVKDGDRDNNINENEIKNDDNKVNGTQYCNVMVQCGGNYASNPKKLTNFCQGYILETKEFLKLPSLKGVTSNHSSIYHKDIGLIIVGGRDKTGKLLRNVNKLDINYDINTTQNIKTIKWKNNYFPKLNLRRGRHPSLGFFEYNNRKILFCCGGRDAAAIKECEVLKFDENNNHNNEWIEIKPMKYSRSFGSNIIQWKYSRNNNRMIILGGYGSFHAESHCEVFDVNKQIWYDLPQLNYWHKYNPNIFFINNNNILCCCIDKRTKDNLGFIELFDERDNHNKWLLCKYDLNDYLGFNKTQELRRLIVL